MKALLCKRHGKPDTLVLGEVPSPVPGPGQVVIGVHAAAVNFPDTLIIEDRYQLKPPLPFSPGSEVAGTLLALGSGVSGLRVGQPVIGICGWGGFAEEVLTAARNVVPLPAGVAMDAAAALVITYGTTQYAFRDRAHLQAGETLLVLGAAGGTGSSAVELGKLMGARVIAAASSADKLALARRCGADECIDYSREDLKERLKSLTQGRGVDVVYDPVGGPLTEAAMRCMAWEGRYLVIGFSAGEIPRPPLNLALLKGFSIVGVYFGRSREERPERSAELLDELTGWLAEGRIRPVVTQRLPLEQGIAALNDVAARRVLGKIVLTTALGRGEVCHPGASPPLEPKP